MSSKTTLKNTRRKALIHKARADAMRRGLEQLAELTANDPDKPVDALSKVGGLAARLIANDDDLQRPEALREEVKAIRAAIENAEKGDESA